MALLKYAAPALIVVLGVFGFIGCPPNTLHMLTLDVFPVKSGRIVATPDQTLYRAGQAIALDAIPNAGYEFSHWEGNVSNRANPSTTIALFEDGTATAHFVEVETSSGEGEAEEAEDEGEPEAESPSEAEPAAEGEGESEAEAPVEGETDLEALQGNWVTDEIDDPSGTFPLTNVLLTFSDDGFVLRGTPPGDGDTMYVRGDYVVNQDDDPTTIDFTADELCIRSIFSCDPISPVTTYTWLYELDGDSLSIEDEEDNAVTFTRQ